MFDFGVGYSELFIIAVVAIIVIGPKDLPRVLRAFGKTVAKMRGMAREFQSHLDGALKEAGLDDVKRELQGLQTIGSIEPARSIAPPKPPDNEFAKYFGEAPAGGIEKAADRG
ncbi:MAG: twin-arginine translocase subunit TatB [Rhizobiales bacterium]|nr:twin-arginine translocase subunit TatB [Hyphomicrobiales bacterium]MBI3673523.1 twin-arginine translocase subunit TatB [Hyphomicrobiales bacterium]